MNVLLGLTGSVASVLHKKIVDKLSEKNNVKVILTKSSKNFLNSKWLCYKSISYYDDDFEWRNYYKTGNVAHIDLRQWADLLLIAPCSANTMAKLANGICDNLLTSTFRAWDFKKPVYIAPAMNAYMFNHPITESHIATLKKWNCNIIPPIKKELFCGEYGVGGMEIVDKIVDKINSCGNQDFYPPPPPPPLQRVIRNEGSSGRFCEKCRSSMIRKYIFFGKEYCVNHKCSNHIN